MRKLIFGFIVLVIIVSGCTSTPPTPPPSGDPWASVRAADVPVFSSEWKSTPVRLEASDNGWEDSLFVTPDGKRVYFAYYSGDLISDAAKHVFNGDLDIYYSDAPFTQKEKDTRFHLSEKIWSEVGPMIASNGDYFYNSNRDYLNDQKSDTDIYLGNDRLAMNDALGSERDLGNPHYCTGNGNDELWMDEHDKTLLVLKHAKAGNFSGTPELAPAPLQVASASNFQPWLSEDCNTIYFSTNRGDIPGVTGPAIYRSTRNPDNTWTSPVPVAWSKVGLGEATLTADGSKLFFIQLFKNDKGEFTTDMFYVEK